MDTFTYRLNCGQYVLHKDLSPIGPVMDEVALCIDAENGVLHKHGIPAVVGRWHYMTANRLREHGFDDMAKSMVVIQGRFTLEELNRCLSTSGYALKLLNSIKDGSVVTLDLFGTPIPSKPAIN